MSKRRNVVKLISCLLIIFVMMGALAACSEDDINKVTSEVAKGIYYMSGDENTWIQLKSDKTWVTSWGDEGTYSLSGTEVTLSSDGKTYGVGSISIKNNGDIGLSINKDNKVVSFSKTTTDSDGTGEGDNNSGNSDNDDEKTPEINEDNKTENPFDKNEDGGTEDGGTEDDGTEDDGNNPDNNEGDNNDGDDENTEKPTLSKEEKTELIMSALTKVTGVLNDYSSAVKAGNLGADATLEVALGIPQYGIALDLGADVKANISKTNGSSLSISLNSGDKEFLLLGYEDGYIYLKEYLNLINSEETEAEKVKIDIRNFEEDIEGLANILLVDVDFDGELDLSELEGMIKTVAQMLDVEQKGNAIYITVPKTVWSLLGGMVTDELDAETTQILNSILSVLEFKVNGKQATVSSIINNLPELTLKVAYDEDTVKALELSLGDSEDYINAKVALTVNAFGAETVNVGNFAGYEEKDLEINAGYILGAGEEAMSGDYTVVLHTSTVLGQEKGRIASVMSGDTLIATIVHDNFHTFGLQYLQGDDVVEKDLNELLSGLFGSDEEDEGEKIENVDKVKNASNENEIGSGSVENDESSNMMNSLASLFNFIDEDGDIVKTIKNVISIAKENSVIFDTAVVHGETEVSLQVINDGEDNDLIDFLAKFLSTEIAEMVTDKEQLKALIASFVGGGSGEGLLDMINGIIDSGAYIGAGYNANEGLSGYIFAGMGVYGQENATLIAKAYASIDFVEVSSLKEFVYTGEIIHADNNCDGICEICGYDGLTPGHIDIDEDDYCDRCDEYVGCKHESVNEEGYCEICEEHVNCEDIDEDDFCDECDKYVGCEHRDTTTDGNCVLCGEHVYCVDDDADGNCNVCGEHIWCSDEDLDGYCDTCGTHCCLDIDEDDFCDECDSHLYCVDDDGNGFCDICQNNESGDSNLIDNPMDAMAWGNAFELGENYYGELTVTYSDSSYEYYVYVRNDNYFMSYATEFDSEGTEEAGNYPYYYEIVGDDVYGYHPHIESEEDGYYTKAVSTTSPEELINSVKPQLNLVEEFGNADLFKYDQENNIYVCDEIMVDVFEGNMARYSNIVIELYNDKVANVSFNMYFELVGMEADFEVMLGYGGYGIELPDVIQQ